MTANNVIIREMCADDITFVAENEKKNFSTPWREADLTKALDHPTELFYVATLNAKRVGYIGLMLSLDSADILNVCVVDEYRGRGVATKILSFVLDQLSDRGIDKVFLEVRQSNLPARALYEKFGFVYLNKRKNYYKEPIEDAWVMVKETVSENFSD